MAAVVAAHFGIADQLYRSRQSSQRHCLDLASAGAERKADGFAVLQLLLYLRVGDDSGGLLG